MPKYHHTNKAVAAVKIAKINPSKLQTKIGQSVFSFTTEYKIHELLLNIVAIGKITDPGLPDKLSLI